MPVGHFSKSERKKTHQWRLNIYFKVYQSPIFIKRTYIGHTSTDFLAKPQISTKPKATPSSLYPDKSYRLTKCDFNEAFCPVLCLQWESYNNEVLNWDLTLDGDITQYSQEKNTYNVQGVVFQLYLFVIYHM